MDPAAKPAAVAAPEAVMLTSGASGRVNALLSLRAFCCLLLVLYAVLLFILFPFRWRPRLPPCPGPASRDDRREGSRKSGAGTVVVRVPAAMVPRRQREQEAAARRAAAIRLVVSAREEGRRGRDFSLFTTARGETLFTQSWAPVTVKTKGMLVLMHGLNEHSGRYDHFAKKLNDNGLKVYAMDWIVAFESAFSTGGRALDKYRSALKENIVEALICTRDWVFGKKDDLESELDEIVENVMDPNSYNEAESTQNSAANCNV